MRIVVYGKVPSKSNQYKLSARGGHARMYSSAEVTQYKKDFLKQITGSMKNRFSREQRLEVVIVWYKESLRGDSDGVLKVVLDCMQDAKIIHNDNKIDDVRVLRAPKDKEPRIEIFIKAIPEGNYFYDEFCWLCQRFL